MKPYWRNTEPNKTMLSATLTGSRPVSSAFLRALHSALQLDDDELEPEDWIRLSAAEFRQRLAAARTKDLNKLFRRIVPSDAPGIVDEIVVANRRSDSKTGTASAGQVVLGMGSQRDGAEPVVSVGDQIQLRLQLPFAGYLTVLSADPGNPYPNFYSLAPWLRCTARRFDVGRLILPQALPLIPVNPPANVTSTLIAILTKEPPQLPWTRQQEELPLEPEHVRSFALDVLRMAEQDRRVQVLDYYVEP